MRPATRAKPPKPAKKAPEAEGIEPGDLAYVQHAQRGPIAVKVLAAGARGLTGRCDRKMQHKVTWDRVLGVKARMLHRYDVVDQGADGAILADAKGRRRYLAGEAPMSKAKPAPAPAAKQDDPITGGLDRLAKAMILFKAGPIANRGGLSLSDVTDKMGRRTKRWVRNMKDQPKERKPGMAEESSKIDDPRQTDLEEFTGKPKGRAPIKHGDAVRFRHGDVEGQGKVVGSGADGVTVRSEDGREHQVRHEHLVGPSEPKRPEYPDRKDGEDDKSYLKRATKDMPDPDHLPEDHGRYFNLPAGHKMVPIDQLVSTKSDAENEKGGRNAPKIMQAAYRGLVGKRDPINARQTADGRYEVTDGNGTLTGARRLGWKSLPVNVEGAEQPKRAGLFEEADVAGLPLKAVQPVKDRAELFAKSGEALEHLRTWLDKGDGICAQLGHQMMTKSPGQVTDEEWAKPGGMLFIAPMKGEKRAAEKVESDYSGDWSRLTDTVRCSIAVDAMDDLPALVAELKKGGMKLAQQPKDRFAKPPPVGYRDALLNVEFPNGIVGEVQLHVKAMLRAKNEGHHHYETQRSLVAKIPPGGPPPSLSPEDEAKVAESIARQKEIYSSAWQQATGSGKDKPMAKAMRSGRKMNGKAGGAAYFEHEGAYYRRTAPERYQSIDDVLVDGAWQPYKGADRIKPAMFGDPVPDPLAKGGEGAEPAMAKAVLLFQAPRHGAAD